MPKIHRPMFENFHGSDHMNVDDLTALILELVNDKYSVEQLKEDIHGMWENELDEYVKDGMWKEN